MWARRLGVPPLWPSRVKVLCLGVLASVFIFSLYQYLAEAGAEYLRLTEPRGLDIVCRLPNADCQIDPHPAECVVTEDKNSWVSDVTLSNPCPLSPAADGQNCLNLSLPISTLSGSLGSLHTTDSGFNPFKVWSVLFIVLMSLLALSIITHDMALLDAKEIFTLADVCNQKPEMRRYILCLRCRKRTGSRWRIAGNDFKPVCCLVPWALIQAIAFMIVVYPFSLVFFLIRPVRMSRMMVFLSSILCSLWSAVFAVLAATKYRRDNYTLYWSYVTPPDNPNCVCMCDYPLRRDVSFRMFCMGLAVMAHSTSLAFRALKGLRRSQWANLFSVLYAVPIAAFPVAWSRPPESGGGPVDNRTDGEPVQGEPAFDPFCLMDEQPESAFTRACLLPVPRPDMLQSYELSARTEDVGGCGFPRFLPSGRPQAARSALLHS
mmetsp:Transcript_42176/g.113775  ORF Transcript_42176/g.113775 Transcript_42176/m.113775 type:complete len:433 (-) Transcript_42176:27-1325(-)